MGLDAASCCSSPGIKPFLQEKAVLGTDRPGCAAPPCVESPLPSSDLSTSPSSTSENPCSSEFNCEASNLCDRNGSGDTSSAVSTSSSKEEPSSAHFDGCGVSSDHLNVPSPILEEDLGLTMRELEESDGMSKDVDLDTKPCLDDMRPLEGRLKTESGCEDDMLLSRLDKLLDSGSSQEVVDENGLTFMEDIFPDMSCTSDFCMLDEMSSLSAVDNFQGFESSSMSHAGDLLAASSCSAFSGEEESASQVFARWLQSNAHWVSLSDLRKIKLKTSTIENVTRRLGGGKTGLMLFLKFVLTWVQNSRQNDVTAKNASSSSPVLQHPGEFLLPGPAGTTPMCMEGFANGNRLGTPENSNGFQEVKAQTPNPFSSCGSLATNSLSGDWTTSTAQGAQAVTTHPNLSCSMSGGYALSRTDGGVYSPLPNTNPYHANSQWLHHSSNVVHRERTSSLSPSLQPLATGSKNCIGGICSADASSLTMTMQQQQCRDANPAATFRAARKNRMERQRWSVRRNRKWAGSNQHQRLAAVTASNGFVQHSNVASWSSQPLMNGVQKVPYLNSQSRQQTAKGANTTDHQQSKRLLFHKELKQSDVGSLGRIVLPKKAAETCLPPLELRDGVNLVVEDIHSNKVWTMRYRFWPNNKSRMYLLENTSDFVRLNNLKEGDYMMMYLYSHSNRYAIRGVKGTGVHAGASSGCNTETKLGAEPNRNLLKEEASSLASFIPGGANSEDSCEDSSLVDLIEQSLEDIRTH